MAGNRHSNFADNDQRCGVRTANEGSGIQTFTSRSRLGVNLTIPRFEGMTRDEYWIWHAERFGVVG